MSSLSRILKLLKKRFNKFYNIYRKNEIPFTIALDSIIDDIIHFKEQFLAERTILRNSYVCNDSNNMVEYTHEVSFLNKLSCEINSCKRQSLVYFYENYKKEIGIIKVAIDQKEIKQNQKFLDAFDILINILNIGEIDGRKHYCYGLVDLLLS